MNRRQLAAIRNLERALERAGEAGLQGGVYEGSFCVWPANINITPDSNFLYEHDDDGNEEIEDIGFFTQVEKHGEILNVFSMSLDGGAGV